MALARETTNADAGSLYLIDPSREELLFRVIQSQSLSLDWNHTQGTPSPLPNLAMDGSDGFHFALDALTAHKAVVGIPDKAHGGTLKNAAMLGYSPKLIASVAILAEGTSIGVLQVINPQGGRFSRKDLNDLFALASVAGSVVRNSRILVDLKRANELNQARRTLISGIAHDLKSPLAIIANAGDVVAEVEGMASLGEGIRKEAEVLLSLTNDLVDLLRMEEGLESSNPVPFDVAETVAGITSGLDSLFDRVGADCELLLPEGIAGFFDGRHFRRILLNLISNALHHGKGKSVIVSARTTRSGVEVVVQDEGPGIPTSQQTELFEPKSRKGSGGAFGSGLGLSVSRRLAHLNNADLILAPSRVGARFVLSFPSA